MRKIESGEQEWENYSITRNKQQSSFLHRFKIRFHIGRQHRHKSKTKQTGFTDNTYPNVTRMLNLSTETNFIHVREATPVNRLSHPSKRDYFVRSNQIIKTLKKTAAKPINNEMIL